MIPDIITASFEIGASLMTFVNIRAIQRDKVVRGVSIWPTAFFAAWGVWNLWFFGYVGMPLSQTAALFVAIGNSVWIYLALKYRDNDPA